MTDFQEFPKMPRLSRECVVTEKIDGTNACIAIEALDGYPSASEHCIWQRDGLAMFAGSRNGWITPARDHYGFAAWCVANADDLALLGPGRHHGEWWGKGVNLGYGLNERRLSLFNTSRWEDDAVRPKRCHVVPVLYRGTFDTEAVLGCLDRLKSGGSVAAPGFMQPEGVVVFHEAAGVFFKKTIKRDEERKGAWQGKR